MRPKRLKWALMGVVGLVVIVGGGRFAIHQIQGKSKPPLALSTVTSTTGSVGTGSTGGTGATSSAASSSDAAALSGTWNVSTGSQAGYRIKETLFGQSNTAVGRTTAVTGTMTIGGTAVTAADLTVDMTKVSSDRPIRDSQFQGRIMSTATFPTATFKLTKPIPLATLPADGVQVTEQATGDLMLHGVTKPVSFPITAQRTGSTIQVNGSIPITFADWNISNPSAGPAQTADNGSLEFLVNFGHG